MTVEDETPGAGSAATVTHQGRVEAADAAQPGDSPARIFNRRVSGATAEKFPRSVRIVRSLDYQALYKTSSKIHSPHFVLFGCCNTLGHCRLGITASRKVGGAVVRNRVKRLFREIFRRTLNQIPNRFDMVVNVKSGCGNVCYEDLRVEFLAAVKKLADRYPG